MATATNNSNLGRLGNQIQDAANNFNSSPSSLPLTMVYNAGATAISAVLFTSIGPVGGAVFGATQLLASRTVNWILEKCEIQSDSALGRAASVGKTIISIGAGLAAGWGALSLMGYTVAPLTIAALALGGAVIGVVIPALLIATVAGTIFCCCGGPQIIQDLLANYRAAQGAPTSAAI